MAKQIHLIRHGETEWSLTGQHTGRTDLPLTPKGEMQAARLRQRLQSTAFDHVLSSPLIRAHRTCLLAGLGNEVQIDPDLQEWDYGIYDGLTTVDIRAKNPDWDVFRDGAPQGESVAKLTSRLDRVIATLHGLDGEVVIFSHGHFLRALATRWTGLPLTSGHHFPLDTCSISRLGYERADRVTPAITLWNAAD